MSDYLAAAFPKIGAQLPKVSIAALPTPVSEHELTLPAGSRNIVVKHDEATSALYGGNKVRKLEYLLQRAKERGARRVATFGAAGSNHALATAIHAAEIGLDCTCFLSHQRATPKVPVALNMHRRLGTEVFRFGHGVDAIKLFRRHLQHRRMWVIPLGGTCWLGALGFVNAGLELAQQVADGIVEKPDHIYMACGTTGSAAGLAVGLAVAGLETTVQAIQVADNPFASEEKMRRLVSKIQLLLQRMDPMFGAVVSAERLVWRDEFLAGGYARVDAPTENAVAIAKDQADLSLETTYTGKAFAAMLHDLQASTWNDERALFWNTYNAQPLPVDEARPDDLANIPADFERYYA